METGTKDYLKEGFVDVPRIVEERLEFELYPGLLHDVYEIRKRDFPLFDRLGRVYLDNAATTQEPQSVRDKMNQYRTSHLRGSSHAKNSAEAREAQYMFDESRRKLESFFNARNYVIGFTGGTTDTSNWIATRFPFKKDDLLLLTGMEHNSQILTARNFAKSAGAEVAYVPVSMPEGRLSLDHLEDIVSKRKKGKILLNLVHASNVTGVINPVEKIRGILGDRGFVYLDMAQSAGHMPVDLDKMDVDFAGVSAHKMYGPTGIGAMFINKRSRRYVSDKISGGDAVNIVSKLTDVPSEIPSRFEPGTQDLDGAIEWGYAIDYLRQIGMERIEKHDKELGKYFAGELEKIDDVKIYGPRKFEDRTAVVTINIGSYLRRNYDSIARMLDDQGISVRDGCFCAHIYVAGLFGIPTIAYEARTALMKIGVSEKILKLPGAVRFSFAFYNTLEDAYKAVVAIRGMS